MDDGVTDEGMHTLCVRLPALVELDLQGVKSLTADRPCTVDGLTTLNVLYLGACCDVTDVVLRGSCVASPSSASTAATTSRTWGVDNVHDFDTSRPSSCSPSFTYTTPVRHICVFNFSRLIPRRLRLGCLHYP